MSVIKSLLIAGTILLSAPSSVAAVEVVERKPNQTLTTALAEPEVDSELPLVEEVPSVGALLLDAALAQEGIPQDCTDLVQNALAAIRYTTRRDQGGFDFGVDDVAYTFGVQIPVSEAQPGDIATVGPGNGGHVWIILDPATNTGVHGGWEGMTVVGTGNMPLEAHTTYRVI